MNERGQSASHVRWHQNSIDEATSECEKTQVNEKKKKKIHAFPSEAAIRHVSRRMHGAADGVADAAVDDGLVAPSSRL
jgi:hypothetical protein